MAVKERRMACEKERKAVLQTLAKAGFTSVRAPKSPGSLSIVLETRQDRGKYLQDVAAKLNARYDKTPTSISSVGRVIVGDCVVYAKPPLAEGQRMAAGIANEFFLVNRINEACDADGVQLDITFNDGERTWTAWGVSGARHTAGVCRGGKGDVMLECSDGDLAVSVKQSDSGMWESPDGTMRDVMDRLIEAAVNAGDVLVEGGGSGYRLDRAIWCELTGLARERAIFGSRGEFVEGAVVVKTFNEEDFIQRNRTEMSVFVDLVATELDEIPKWAEPVLLVRNDSTRTSKYSKYPGLRPVVVFRDEVPRSAVRVKGRAAVAHRAGR